MKKIRLLRDWSRRDRRNRGMIVIAHACDELEVKDGGDIDRADAETLVKGGGAEEVAAEKPTKAAADKAAAGKTPEPA